MSSTPSSRGRRPADRSVVQMVARAPPGVEVHHDVHVPAGEVDRPRSAAAAPPRQTARRSSRRRSRPGRTQRRVVPTAASTRPQLGSLPNSAHLSRLLRAIARPTSTASASVAARSYLDGDLLRGALGVGEQLRAPGRRRRCAPRRRRSPASGVTVEAPLASSEHGVVGRQAAVGVEAVEGRRGGGAQRRVQRRRVDHRIGGQHAQHRGQRRGEHAGSLGHPADGPPGRVGVRRPSWPRVSVVRIASAASAPPSWRSAAAAASMPGSSAAIGSRSPMRPVEQTATSPAPSAECAGGMLGGAVRVGETGRTGAGVGAAGVEHHRAQPAVRENLLRPQHRRRLDPVAGEHAGGGVVRAVVDHQRDVARAAGLQPRGHPRRSEAHRRGHAHGAIPSTDRPVVSGRPSMMLAFCTAWPAAPLPRLSIALVTTMRPESRSTLACR